MKSEYIQIFLEVITAGFGVYLVFFKSYFEERGKIVATKKDIEEITAKIELVKSDIQILTHKKISLSTEKQNCLLEYYDKLNVWLNYLTYLDLTDHSESPSLYFLQVQEKLNKLYQDYLSADVKVDIFFIKDKALLNAKYLLIDPAMKLMNVVKEYLIKIRTEATVFQLIMAIPALPDNANQQKQLYENGEKQVSILKEYYTVRKEIIQSITNLNYKLLEIINDRVINLE